MPRKAHYWKTPKSTEIPRRVLCFDTETWPENIFPDKFRIPMAPAGELHKIRLGVACYTEIRNGKCPKGEYKLFKTSEELQSTIINHLQDKSRLYVIAHNAGFDAGAAQLWQWMFGDHHNWKRVILEKGKFYLEGWYHGKPITWIDTGNYTLASLDEIGRSLGFPKLEMPGWDAPESEWITYCTRDVDVTLRFFTNLVQWVKRNNYGPFAPTAASLSFNTFRKIGMHYKVLVHDNTEALRIERGSYYGGLVETPKIGNAGVSPIYETDVQSMYPYCCTLQLPTRFVGYSSKPTLSMLEKKLENFMCFAVVRLNTQMPYFPLRAKQRVYYPVGQFVTMLPDPELRYAVRNGYVADVYQMSWHKWAYLFKEYMERFFAMKAEAKVAKNKSEETFAKLLMNSLYGKTGQVSHRWHPWGANALRLWCVNRNLPEDLLIDMADNPPVLQSNQQTVTNFETGRAFNCRNIGFGIELDCGVSESRDSVPSIAACVTSYARLYLRQLQRIAGNRNWYYCDTDSIWVCGDGLRNLQDNGMIAEGELGKLGTPEAYKSLHVYGPKDYDAEPLSEFEVEDNWVALDDTSIALHPKRRHKGIRSKAIQIAPNTYSQLQFSSALRQLLGEQREGVIIKHVVKTLRREALKVKVGHNGWTFPFWLPKEQSRIK